MRGRDVARLIAPVLVAALVVAPVPALAQPPAAPAADAAALTGKKILIVGFDALGVEDDKVDRLETLFRMELERLAGAPSPSRRELARALSRAPAALKTCPGEPRCLAAIGKRVGVDLVVAGNVAGLGESYVVNIKVVDVASAAEIRRIASDPLRGSPDELIEAVRVAAYRLLAPSELHGSIGVLADLPGATVELDGTRVGATPLPAPLRGLSLGPHKLVVTAKGYSRFEEEVVVRFQKTSRVVVRLAPAGEPTIVLGGPPVRREERHWYSSTWAIVGIGAAAVVVGGLIGYAAGKDDVIDCAAAPGSCQ